MPANALDRNASSPNRLRRNMQRIGSGAGLVLDPSGALSTGVLGTGVKVDGTTIQIIGDELVAVGGGTVNSTSALLPVWNEVPAGTIDGVNAAFTIAHTPLTNVAVYRNGRLLAGGGNDFSVSGTTITFTTAPASSSLLLAEYWYLGVTGTVTAMDEIVSGTVNGSNTVFTLAHTPVVGTQEVYRNGVRLAPTGDYSITGSTITMVAAPTTGSLILANYQWSATVTLGTAVENETPGGTKNGINTAFTLAHAPIVPFLAVYRDGIRLASTGDYSLSGSTVTMVTAPASSTVLLADYRY